jgi:hypothetical protein
MNDRKKKKYKTVLYVIRLEGREIYNTFHFGEGDVDKLEVLLKDKITECT